MKITDVTSALSAVQLSVSRIPSAAEGAPAVEQAVRPPVDEATVRREVKVANEILQKNANEHLQFSVHEESQRIVVKLVNEVTNEVVREMPPEKFLDLVADLMKLAGLQVDEVR